MTVRRDIPQRLGWLDTKLGLAAMFAAAVVLRLALAPHLGFYGDLNLFQRWAGLLAQVGPHHFYDQAGFADYPPGYLYILWLIGKVDATPGYLLMKLPAIAADCGLAFIVGTLAARIAPAELRSRVPVRALVAGGAVLFNPAFFGLSAAWGQVDAVPALFVLWCLLLLFTGPQSLRREVIALLLFAVAIAMKPQEGFVLPVMLYALYRRHVHGRERTQQVDGLLTIGLGGGLSLGLWAVSGLAFGLSPSGLIHFYSHSASVYPVTSANAFNLWGAVGFWRTDVPGAHGIADFGPTFKVLGVPALYVGWLLFLAGTALVLWQVHRALNRGAAEARLYVSASATLGVLSFVALTRMHERYLFLGLACLAPLVTDRRLRWAFGGLSALYLVNLWWPYAYFNLGWQQAGYHAVPLHLQPVFDWLFGGLGVDSWQRRTLSLLVTAIGLMLAWLAVRWSSEAGSGSWLEQALARHESAERSRGAPLDPVRAFSGHFSRFALPLVRVPRLDTGVGFALPIAESRHASNGGKPEPALIEQDEPESESRWNRFGPLGLVALVCGWGLYVLRSETKPATNLNDTAFHLQMVRWASRQFHEGRIPFDGWFPDLSLGSSFFHHYQSLAEILTGLVVYATGMGNQTAYDWFLYLLLALWPISVYLSARLFDLPRWTAAAAAAVSPLIVSAPGYGYEHSSYTWQGYGVYSQEWAMWLLPLAWGFTWRAVSRGKQYWAAALALALTMATHFITGYLGMVTVGVWAIVGGHELARRIGRSALVAVGSVCVAAWVLVPLLSDTKWTTQSEYYKGTIFNDSYGAQKILGWLVHGNLFDSGRFPIVTLLALGGATVCAANARRDPRARAILGAFLVSLLLFFGRKTWGGAIDVLPGMKDIQIHRFEMGVDLAAILLAGIGVGWGLAQIGRLARRVPRGAMPVAAVVSVLAVVGVLAPAWTKLGTWDQRDNFFLPEQQTADRTDGGDLDKLIAIVKQRGDGRVYAGLRANWGKDYRVGQVPVYAYLSAKDVDAIGFTFRTISSLSTDIEAAFDEGTLAQYQMLNIKYLLLPADHPPPVAARLIASSGRHRLYEVKTTGYFQVVDRSAPISANRTDLEQQTHDWRVSQLASQAVYPGIAWDGSAGAAPTFAGSLPPAGSPGSVLSQSEDRDNGDFAATVRAKRTSVVLLKATYDPRWAVTVDGVRVATTMMAPGLVGVEVGPGRHVIRFHYAPYNRYPLLFALGALALIALIGFERGWFRLDLKALRRSVDR